MNNTHCLFIPIMFAVIGADFIQAAEDDHSAMIQNKFIFETAPFKACHASTIVETKDGLIAAWFGGTAEGNRDVGIWLSRFEDGKWTAPLEVADGVQSPEERYPCWNPVLFQPSEGPLFLFYKIGPNVSKWWGMLITSTDGGRTWSEPRRLPNGVLGPIKNKPIQFSGGVLLCPSSTEGHGWRVHFERTADLGRTWETTDSVNDCKRIAAIQPALLVHADGRIQAVGRTRQGKIFSVSSTDGGKTWGVMTLLDVPNPNSGIDAVTLRDGRHLLIYNNSSLRRSPLNAALSTDGRNWKPAIELDSVATGELSYPAVIQTADGLVHILYTWKRKRIKHVVLDPQRL